MFGGEKKYINNQCLSDVWRFDLSFLIFNECILETHSWEFISCLGIIEPRKYHTANLIGNFMLVYGG